MKVTYTGSTVTAPTFSLEEGTYTSAQTLTLTADDGCTIYYTKNGITPTVESAPYTDPITIDVTTTIKAIAVDGDGNKSAVVARTYTIAVPTFKFSAAEVTVALNGTLVAPTLTNTYGGDVTYTSSEEAIATVNEKTGEVSLFGGIGSTVITATLNSDNSITASYTLIVNPKSAISTDVLTSADFAATENSYKSFTDVKVTTSAVYAGNSAKTTDGAIQLRSSTSSGSDIHSGIVTTTSAGKVKSITIKWNSGTANDRVLDVYGKSTAYTSADDLYASTTQGTNIGSFTKTSTLTQTIELTDDKKFEYVGLRSKNGAMYIDEIQIVWEVPSSATINLVAQDKDGSYYATFGSDEFVVFPEDVTVYAVEVNDGAMNLYKRNPSRQYITAQIEPINGVLVNAKDGVLLKSTTPTVTYYFRGSNYTGGVITNRLYAVEQDGLIDSDNEDYAEYTYYKLAYDDYNAKTGLGFYWGAENGARFESKKGLAYLKVNKPTSDAAPTHFLLGGDTDGISNVKSDVNTTKDGVIYNIAGQRVNAATKPGLYIIGGKKVIIK